MTILTQPSQPPHYPFKRTIVKTKEKMNDVIHDEALPSTRT